VILKAAGGGNREVRMFEAAGFIPRPGTQDAVWSGAMKTRELGIASVAACVRLASEEIGGFVMRTYTGDGQMNRQPKYDTDQARLFQEPGEGWNSFDLWSDTIATLDLEENAFLWKSKVRGKVVELFPLDPTFISVTRKDGVKKIEARINGHMKDVTSNVIHIRAWAPSPSVNGVSTVEMHRPGLKVASGYDTYRGRYLDNNGSPGIVLEVPGSPDKAKRSEMLDAWWKRHGGALNAGKPGIVWGGMKVNQINPNLRDSQAAEIADTIVRDIGRMFRIYPLELLHGEIKGTPRSAESTSDIFVRFSCLHRMRRVERALAADRDLFPDPKLYPRFDVSELLRADFATAATVAHALIQVGAATKNEGRAMVGLPPIEGGDVLQETPVGGAPNAGGLSLPIPQPALDPEDL
jgi:HK97 family phage portal protein